MSKQFLMNQKKKKKLSLFHILFTRNPKKAKTMPFLRLYSSAGNADLDQVKIHKL